MLKTILLSILSAPKPVAITLLSVPVIGMGAGGVAVVRYVDAQVSESSQTSTVGDEVVASTDETTEQVAKTTDTKASESKKTEAEQKKTENKQSAASKKETPKPGSTTTGGTTTAPASPSTPSTPSAPGSSCPNGTHTPGGSDGNGGCWPYAGNTGVPAGTALTNYGGSCSIQSDTTIVGKTINCTLQVFNNSKLIVRNSVVNGFIDNTNATGVGTVTVEDSEVRAGEWVGGAMWGSGLFITRSELTGGQHSVHCEANCTVTDSWLHSQYNPDGGSSHNNAFLSNGGGNMTLRHNTLHCTALLNATDGGCTGDLTLLGDFDEIRYVTADRNLMMANNSSIGYCVNAGYNPGKPFPNAHHMVFTNNVFQRGPNGKCGVYGAITSFNPAATGNVWTNNRWSDGVTLEP